MRIIIASLALCLSLAAQGQSALEQVQRLIYGSNPPPAVAPAPQPAPTPVVSNVPPPTVTKATPPPAHANPTPDWDMFMADRPARNAAKDSPVTATTIKATPTAAAPAPKPPVGAADSKFSPVPDEAFPPEVASEPAVAAPPIAVASAAARPAPAPDASVNLLDDKHKLSPGDKLSFQILEDRDPAKSLVVTDSGELDVPYLGRVRVLDKTCRELGRELKQQLEQEYYYRASVVIGLDAASKVRGKIYIWGQVRNQGAIDIPTGENFTVGKAILRAGGFADFANKKKVKLVRTQADGTKQSFELNLVDVLEKAQLEDDMTVQEDDFIIVPSRLINF